MNIFLIVALSLSGLLKLFLIINKWHLKLKLEGYFYKYIQSINNNDICTFMSYQNRYNHLFYTEQQRWIKEVIFTKNQQFLFDPSIGKIEIQNNKRGLLTFKMKITRPSGRIKNYSVRYVIQKCGGKWVINDYQFLISKRNSLCVNYFADNHNLAQLALIHGNEIANIYKSIFNWNNTNIRLKIYSTLDQISLSIPWFTAYGWNEEKESIKLLIPDYAQDKEDVFLHMLSHELGHKMLSNLTNDNASLYLQEGMATYLEKGIKLTNTFIEFRDDHLIHVKETLERIDYKLLLLSGLNKLTYDDGHTIYNQGFLLVYFLIKKYGQSKFQRLIDSLKCHDYIDCRIHHKLEQVNKRTTKSLETVYGNQVMLCEEMNNFYQSISETNR